MLYWYSYGHFFVIRREMNGDSILMGIEIKFGYLLCHLNWGKIDWRKAVAAAAKRFWAFGSKLSKTNKLRKRMADCVH